MIALAAGSTPTEAAKRAGVSRRTAYRRLEDPRFRDQITQERDTLVRTALGRLSDASLDATDTLRELATGTQTPPAVRVSAARAILDIGLRLREQTQILDRLETLEANQSPQSPPWTSPAA